MFLLPPLLLYQLQNFLNFAYANHMQIVTFYLSFLNLGISRREDQLVTYRLMFGLVFKQVLILCRGYCKVIIQKLVKGSIGPLHVAIFHYELILYSNDWAFYKGYRNVLFDRNFFIY